ncbi:xylitol oxidase [Paenibacillus pasadenensis]|uniref:Xylitol oxidase n=1 Tax=Paenibacillus pasadenensis TaxID=217090 RepID=A0A2N5N181_9BACL|nr:FAD-binding protein [Paenibacillus pasadenensis]PLT44075.1 xylitol oxidase [Paenibacillus pasadenensis]
MAKERNWAGNYTYGAAELLVPESVEEARDIVARSPRVKALGSRHSFNGIADTAGSLISTEKLNRLVSLDAERRTVTVEGGIRYGDLARQLDAAGFALHNLASLPHISVAGAVATATHGSGVRHGNLATAVRGLELIAADGALQRLTREDAEFEGAVVGLGGLGVVARLTLDVVPAFEMSQRVYEDLPAERLEAAFDEILSAAYSVSLFTDWTSSAINQVWIKHRVGDSETLDPAEPFHGAAPAGGPRHPVPGHSGEVCSGQLGAVGPWHERLPHFRMDFTPSAGEELQTEYFVPRERALEALQALGRLRERIAPLLFISEVRTIAADRLWMSPCHGRDSVGIHFTWKPLGEAVARLLPELESALRPFGARPHWAKLFAMPPAEVREQYERLPDFQRLLLRQDPERKFRNDLLERYVY